MKRNDRIQYIGDIGLIDTHIQRIRDTTILEKFAASCVNAVFVFGLATPFLLLWGMSLKYKWAVVLLFAAYEIFVISFRKDRCFGMSVINSYYKQKFALVKHLLYSILYTLSFSTFMLYIYIPGDLLLLNLLFVQLPCIVLTGTTLHGYIAGLETVTIETIVTMKPK